MSMIITWIKDALLCLLICTTLAQMKNSKKAALTSLGIVVILFLMGLDL